MKWVKIEDKIPNPETTLDIMQGLKIMYNYTLVYRNSINYDFVCNDTGHVVSGESVTEWRDINAG